MVGVSPHQEESESAIPVDPAEIKRAAQQLFQLPKSISTDADFVKCADAIRNGQIATFDSVWGSACALLTATLGQTFDRILVITPDNKVQDRILDDIRTFFEPFVDRFPAAMLNVENSVTVDHEYGERLRLLKSLARPTKAGESNFIVANVQALMQSVPTRESITAHSRKIKRGDTLNIEAFNQWLIEHGFHQTVAVELPGEFSSRGGIIDVYAPDWIGPVRIELFDDEVESLRQFETESQRSVEELQQLEITVLASQSDSRSEEHAQLADYLAPETLILQVEPHEIQQAAKTYIERSTTPKALFSWNQIQERLAEFPSATASRVTTGHLDARWQMPVETVEQFSGDISTVKIQVDQMSGKNHVFVIARVDGELPRVREIFTDATTSLDGRMSLAVGCVHEGFRYRGKVSLDPMATGCENGIVVVGCDQIFHRTDVRGQNLRRRGRRKLGKALDSFLDLRNGDLIVHLSHGIGRYRGLKMLEKDGQLTEHLELEFHGGTRIFVPAAKIDLVQKYVGGTKTTPTLARIGNKTWLKQKQAVTEAVTDLASDMLELEAQRSSRPGIAFGMDTQWQSEFEQSFPYRETADQLAAIDAIKHDMQTSRPMDRLLCGDVGFGKTEVAMRAAFKAVENGYQVGMLVPTTVLAEQHYRTFQERMSGFPLEICKLSRFCTTQEMKANLEKIKSGHCDIAIGTHRIVSKDVKFFNLGLVIIDEEQRFGVEHKDRLKNLRASVDVLTLSATPIPRTLHMSLVGVRDISNLETAPDERIPVDTKVMRFNNKVIRQAILRELNRGGQIFFVHNRVNDIHIVKEKLMSIVPEATIDIGHGQMHERDLEKVMHGFINHEFDILLATTIIESGLDIPNANTIFVDQADYYGLSDLHQLRGRVGRYKNKAYCYMLLDPHKHLNPTAAKRLQAIETFSEMGAGFAISMRDLEIRGAGNLLGTQQSGHIAAIGYELYCHLLEKAVRKLKQMPAKISLHVDIDLPVAAYLPDEYITDRRQKIDMYRRLTRLEQFGQIKELRAEMRDRFGKIPGPVKRLLTLSRLKLEAAVWQIEEIFLQDTYLGFRYANRARMEQLVKLQKVIRIVDDKTAFVTLKTTAMHPNKMLALVKSLLQVKS